MQKFPLRTSRPIEGTSLSIPVTSAGAVTLMPNVPEEAVGAILQPSAPIRVRLDGSDPETAIGLLVGKDQTLELESYEECTGFKMIAVDTAATVEIAFWR